MAAAEVGLGASECEVMGVVVVFQLRHWQNMRVVHLDLLQRFDGQRVRSEQCRIKFSLTMPLL